MQFPNHGCRPLHEAPEKARDLGVQPADHVARQQKIQRVPWHIQVDSLAPVPFVETVEKSLVVSTKLPARMSGVSPLSKVGVAPGPEDEACYM